MDDWHPKRERLRFLPLLEVRIDDWAASEEQLLGDALRGVHSAVTPQKVKDEVLKLLHELWHHLEQQRLSALRLGQRLLRHRSVLVASFGLEVLLLCSVDLWLLSFSEREDLLEQVQRMRGEATWQEKASAVLRSLREQEQIFKQRCHSASLAEPWPRWRPLAEAQLRLCPPRAPRRADGTGAAPGEAQGCLEGDPKRLTSLQTFLPGDQPRRYPRCFDSMQVLKWKFELPHRFEQL
eukprot:s631_g41.t1